MAEEKTPAEIYPGAVIPEGLALVVGSKLYEGSTDARRMYPNAIGMDIEPGPGVDFVHDIEQPLPQTYAHIHCYSVLEHVKRPWLAAQVLQDALQPGGTIAILTPFVWRIHGYPDDYWRFTPHCIRELFPRIHFEALGLYTVEGLRQVRNVRKTRTIEPGNVFLERTEVFGFGRKL